MLKITIAIQESAGGSGPARKVYCKVTAKGHATKAEYEFAEHFKPLLEQIMGAKVIDRSNEGHAAKQ